jgi:hypothetical protein
MMDLAQRHEAIERARQAVYRAELRLSAAEERLRALTREQEEAIRAAAAIRALKGPTEE